MYFNLVFFRVTFVLQSLFLSFIIIHLPFVSFRQKRVVTCDHLLHLRQHKKSSTTTIYITYCNLCVSLRSSCAMVSIFMISVSSCGKITSEFFSWCCYYGFLLRCDLKIAPREKVLCGLLCLCTLCLGLCVGCNVTY